MLGVTPTQAKLQPCNWQQEDNTDEVEDISRIKGALVPTSVEYLQKGWIGAESVHQ